MTHYRSTLLLFGALFAAMLATCFATVNWVSELKLAREQQLHATDRARREAAAAQAELEMRAHEANRWRAFARAWEPYRRADNGKELGSALREGLTSLATGAGLTSEGATVTADAKKYHVGGTVLSVQQVSLVVTGDSLPAVLAWLGAAEQKFAYARVETLALSAYASRSVQLAVTLVMPTTESPKSPAGTAVSTL